MRGGAAGAAAAGEGTDRRLTRRFYYWECEPASVRKLAALGEGQFGTVHEAEFLGQRVAAKEMKLQPGEEEAAVEAEFLDELAIMSLFDHPNVVKVYGACTDARAGATMLLMECCSGGSVGDLSGQVIQPSIGRCLEIAIDIAQGMDYLHSRLQGVCAMHRDLKPSNILIAGDPMKGGVAKISDFGLVRLLEPESGGDGQGASTASGRVVDPINEKYYMTAETGSYRFMSPEVFSHASYNHKADLYSYGMILYQMFDKRLPFDCIEPEEVAQLVLDKARPSFRRLLGGRQEFNIPEPIREIITKCWASRPEARPEFREVAAELLAAQEALDPAKKAAGAAAPNKGLFGGLFGR